MKIRRQSNGERRVACGRISIALGIVVLLGSSQQAFAQWTNGTNVTNTNSGNVGIGTSNPTYGKLQVNKSIRIDDDTASATGSDTLGGAPNLYFGTSTGGNLFQYNGGGGLDLWQYNTGWFQTVTFAKTGNVGIGTTSPITKLELHHSSANNNVATADLPDLVMAFRNTNNTNGNMSLISFIDSAGWGNAHFGAIQTNQTSHSADLIFSTRNAGTFGERIRIRSDGNVGIGTTAPAAKLHVNGDGRITGNLTVDGNIAAKYQDVAEWVPSTRALPAGTVVTLNRTTSNLVEPSTKAYDTRVAGVISERPGIALGERGENKVLVATTGRVRIKVDATHAPIEIGDLLVTSEKEGVAMKSVPVDLGGVQIHRPGTLIGKALEPLSKGTGEILVLLSLQ